MIKAHISDYLPDGIAVWITNDDPRLILRINGNLTTFEPLPDQPVQADPTIRLNHNEGRALLDALLRYYQGASDMHTARADLLHERGRVDQLLGVMTELATRPQTIQVTRAEQ